MQYDEDLANVQGRVTVALETERSDRRSALPDLAEVLLNAVGSGRLKDVESARELACTMVDLGKDAGVNTVAQLTYMQTPLGLTAGNALEVRESLEVLAAEMLAAAGRGDVNPADALRDGRAMDVWRAMVTAQGGDSCAALPVASQTHQILAPGSGVLTSSTRSRLAWLRGASAPVARARRTGSRPARASRCTPSPVRFCGPGTRC